MQKFLNPKGASLTKKLFSIAEYLEIRFSRLFGDSFSLRSVVIDLTMLSKSSGFFFKLYPTFIVAKKFLADAEGKCFRRFMGIVITIGIFFARRGISSLIELISREVRYPVAVVFSLCAFSSTGARSISPVTTLILSSGRRVPLLIL